MQIPNLISTTVMVIVRVKCIRIKRPLVYISAGIEQPLLFHNFLAISLFYYFFF